MKVTYDMISGQFIDDEVNPQAAQPSSYDVTHHEELSLQLQLVESSSEQQKNKLPADIAYRAFLLKK